MIHLVYLPFVISLADICYFPSFRFALLHLLLYSFYPLLFRFRFTLFHFLIHYISFFICFSLFSFIFILFHFLILFISFFLFVSIIIFFIFTLFHFLIDDWDSRLPLSFRDLSPVVVVVLDLRFTPRVSVLHFFNPPLL